MGSDTPDIPSGTVGVACGDLTRYADFLASMLALSVPPGSRRYMARSCSIVDNVNDILRNSIGDWVMLMGDDHIFAPDFLKRLLRAMYEHDFDIVVPLCLKRTHPYTPVVYDTLTEEGDWHVLDLDAVADETQPVEVEGAGTAGMVIRRRVLDKLTDPWMRAGGIGKSTYQLAEDLRFCLDARRVGFRIHALLDVPLGHTTAMTVWPHKNEQGWGVRFNFDMENAVCVPRGQIV